jgi:hypothetical protein
MATAESREERLARFAAMLDEQPDPDIQSVEELARSEQARASRLFGFAQPLFRTSVKLRFSGEGVNGHDLNGATAGAVIGGVSEVVDAAAQDIKIAKGTTQLFLSPTVAPGSAILELFGPPVTAPSQEKLDTQIDDSPTDSAIARVFSLVDAMNTYTLETASAANIEMGTRLGNKLFALSNALIENSIDLGLIWTRPRGRQQQATFARSTAYGFRALLDVEKVEEITVMERGLLSAISTDGTVHFTYGDKRDKRVSLDGSELEREELRGLWATEVDMTWLQRTKSHPRRGQADVQRIAVSVQAPPS